MFIRLGLINLYGVVNGIVECFENVEYILLFQLGKRNPNK